MIQYFKDVLQQNWLVKGFLGLLTISFGIWGVGDALNRGMNPKVAVSVGKSEIGLEDVQFRYTRDLERMKGSMGKIESDDMKRSILNQTVQEIARDTTLDNAASDLGIVITDDHLRGTIRENPAFKDETGAFSQQRYADVLFRNNLT